MYLVDLLFFPITRQKHLKAYSYFLPLILVLSLASILDPNLSTTPLNQKNHENEWNYTREQYNKVNMNFKTANTMFCLCQAPAKGLKPTMQWPNSAVRLYTQFSQSYLW